MKPSQLVEAIEVAIRADQPLLIEAGPGVGKSALVHQTALAMGKTILDERVSDRDPVEVCGLYAVKDGQTIRTKPAFLPSDPDGDYVLFLDEITTAVPLMQAVCYQIVHDRRAGSHPLPKRCAIIAAGNRLSDAAVANRMSTALRSRFTCVELDADMEEWSEWAIQPGVEIDPMVVAFLRWRPALLHNFDKNAKNFPCPRTWEFVSKLLKNGPMSAAVEFEMIKGAIGQGAAVEFAAFQKIARDVPSVDGILLNPEKAALPSEPAACFAVATALAYRATKGNIGSCFKYMERLKKPEYSVLFTRTALNREPKLENTKEFTQWGIKYQKITGAT